MWQLKAFEKLIQTQQIGHANAKWHMVYKGFHEVPERLENKHNLYGPKSEPCGTPLI